jgi:tRNA 2-thiouridine synthesizing protein C
MNPHFFLLSSPVTQERLTWIGECLRYYFIKLNPENFLHHAKADEGTFTFLLTGDALYSLHDPATVRLWENLLALPSVTLICDRQELSLRGISIEGLKRKLPDQVIDHNRLGINGQQSFWNDVAKIARQHEQPIPSIIGYLQLDSPYMNRSPLYCVKCLQAAVEVHASVELYAYLDGIHCGHISQSPSDFDNIGDRLEDIAEKAAKRGLQSLMLSCSRCALARGYSTWDEGEGELVSSCTIRPYRIRNLNEMVERFGRNHIILAENSASLQIKKEGSSSSFSRAEPGRATPLLILVTGTPYGSERAFGAVSFAVACAGQGILTRVVFIENGVYCLTGSPVPAAKNTWFFNLQEVIDAVAGSADLQFFSYQPSLTKRGMAKNPKMNAVLDIGTSELGQMLFTVPKGHLAGHQRVLFF